MSVFDRFRRKSGEPDLSKAVATPNAGSNGVMAVADAATLLQAATAGARGNGLQVTPSQPLTRDPLDLLTFGPGHPLFPQNIDPARPDTQRPEPRIYDFPVSVNLPGVTDRLIPWKVLRDAAQSIGLFRRCIEVRKNEIEGLDWDITVSRDAISLAMRNDPSKGRNDVEAELRDKLEPEIGRLRKFWQNPDPGNGYSFVEWTKQLLEEHLVLDAVSIYPRRTYGGQVWALECLDGSTIKPLLDHRGGRPLPPHPAYQQILQGFPRGEFIATTVADAAGQITIPNAYPADQLIYRRRNVRTHTPYGLSAVERALFDGDVWLRRMEWIKSEYTAGAMPPARLKNTSATNMDYWTPQNLEIYERAMNDMLAGQTNERRLLKLNPPGWEIDGATTDAADQYKPDYDLFLIKLVSGHFDTVSTEIGFAEAGGLGGTGYHEGQSDINERAGTNPTLKWLQALLTDLTRQQLGGPPELEFKFLGLDSEDEDAVDEVWSNRVQQGRATLNEDRDRIGAPRYSFAEADMPMLMTARGIVFIDGAQDAAQNGTLIGPAMASPQQDATEAGADDTAPDDGSQPASGKPAAKKTAAPAKAATTTSKADELKALRSFLAKKTRTRSFEAEFLTKADLDAAGIPPGRVIFKADGGSGGASARGARRRTGGVDRVPALPVGDGDRQPLPYRAGT